MEAARDSNPVQSFARSRTADMEFALRSGGHGRPRLHGVLISAAIYTVFDKSGLCMGVELGLAVRDHRVVRVFEIFCLFDNAVGGSDDIMSHGRVISET